MQQLPLEIVTQIAAYTRHEDLLDFKLTCRIMHAATRSLVFWRLKIAYLRERIGPANTGLQSDVASAGSAAHSLYAQCMALLKQLAQSEQSRKEQIYQERITDLQNQLDKQRKQSSRNQAIYSDRLITYKRNEFLHGIYERLDGKPLPCLVTAKFINEDIAASIIKMLNQLDSSSSITIEIVLPFLLNPIGSLRENDILYMCSSSEGAIHMFISVAPSGLQLSVMKYRYGSGGIIFPSRALRLIQKLGLSRRSEFRYLYDIKIVGYYTETDSYTSFHDDD